MVTKNASWLMSPLSTIVIAIVFAFLLAWLISLFRRDRDHQIGAGTIIVIFLGGIALVLGLLIALASVWGGGILLAPLDTPMVGLRMRNFWTFTLGDLRLNCPQCWNFGVDYWGTEEINGRDIFLFFLGALVTGITMIRLRR